MLSLIPLWLASSYAQTAELIDPGGGVANRWRVGLAIVSALTFVQITSACARGGRLRHFLWPVGMPFWLVRGLRSGGLYAAARDGFWEFVAVLRLPYYFRLGLIGFLGTLAWIVVPAGLIAASGRYPPLGFLGAMILAFVAPSLPFLQVRYHVKSGVSPLFLPEKTNRHRITRAVDIQDGSFSVSPVSRREAFVAAGRKSQDTIFENDTAGVKTEGVISRAVHCFKMPSLAKSPPTCDAFRRSASAMLVPPMVRSKPIVAFRKAAITSGPERLRIRLASSPIVTLRT